MSINRLRTFHVVILLTLFLAQGCSLIEERFQESCQSHAYTQTILTDYISTRFVPNAPVRIGIIPASAPANMSSFSNEQPGAGNLLAWRIHQDLLNYGELPIIEVLNRHEWPGKKEEFFTGNFGAIRAGRDAGFDMVLVSYIEPQRGIEDLTAYSKLIDTSSGVTVYYGKSTAHTNRPMLQRAAAPVGLMERNPSLVYTNNMIEKLGQCISQSIMAEKTTPE